MIPTTVLDPEGREVETLVEPEPVRDYSRWVEFCQLQAAANALLASSADLEALAEAYHPNPMDREARSAACRENAQTYRNIAERYRRMAEGH